MELILKTKKFDFEAPLTSLVWITSILSIFMTFGVSNYLLKDLGGNSIFMCADCIVNCNYVGLLF